MRDRQAGDGKAGGRNIPSTSPVQANQVALLACLRCATCGEPLVWDKPAGRCVCGATFPLRDNMVVYSTQESLQSIAETRARDRQAAGYLEHVKFPIQIFRVCRFFDRLPEYLKERPVYELACGPGPYTAMLLDRCYRVLAADLSVRSLEINRRSCAAAAHDVLHVAADVKMLRLAPASAGLLLMCDFLQHLGDWETRRSFLVKAFTWLAPGGYFYLSFFNFNVVNRLKRDRVGTFSDGAIPYQRSTVGEVLDMLPNGVIVDNVTPMNIFHDVVPDRIVSSIPGAHFLSRMMAIEGRKTC